MPQTVDTQASAETEEKAQPAQSAKPEEEEREERAQRERIESGVTEEPARIAILFETPEEFQIVRRHLHRLAEWKVRYVLTMASALKTPVPLANWIGEREREGVEVFIVAAGGAATLAGAVAARTDRPVIGVPLDTTHLRGQDALHAMSEMPVGVPVATVGINALENAFYGAIRMLALHRPQYAVVLRRLRIEWAKTDHDVLQNLQDQYPEAFDPATAGTLTVPGDKPRSPGGDSQPPGERSAERPGPRPPQPPAPEEMEEERETIKRRLAERSAAKQAEEESAEDDEPKAAKSRARARRIVVDPEQPDVAAIEEVADILLSGAIVALPTDTVYGLAALSTNAEAVRRLYDIKRRDRNKPIPLLVHSTRHLPNLVTEVPERATALLESHWPGALTVVFRKHPKAFAEVSAGDTIGIRMPDSTVALAVISMLARPLAVTSANVSGARPALTADAVMESFGDVIDCVLDGGTAPGEKVSTVLLVVEEKFRVLREGAIAFAELKAVLGEALDDL